MKVSIITVNLNNRQGLQKTVTSVLSQTYRDFEYIVIDGDSTDGSKEVIGTYAHAFSYWVSEQDNGIYHAMNKGIERATAAYLLFLNSGDVLSDPSILDQVVPSLGSAEIVYGNLWVARKGSFKERIYPDRLTFSYFVGKSIGHPASFIKKSLFERVGHYDENMQICADWAFFLKAIGLFKASYQHIPLIVAIFNADGVSSLAENRATMLREQVNFLKNNFSFFETDYESYMDLKDKMSALRRSKPYKFLKFLGLSKYQS